MFPCLGVNDVLRFRATCKTAKTLSEDYLRRHPRSQSKVRIIFHPEGERVYLRSADEWALNAFLSEDASSSIRIPTGLFEFQSRFYQSFNIFGHSRLPDFLEKYGNQIKYLTVPSLQIPMGYEEWEFYKKVPKLKGLTVQMLKIVPELIPEPENVTFPEIFKQLEILEIPRTATPNSGLLWKWKLVEQCTKLKTISWHLQLPGEFEKMRELLEHGKLKKLQCCYIDFVSGFGEYQIAEVAVPWIPGLCELVKKYQLKLLNANSKYLSKFAITQMEQIAPHISSIKWAPLSEPYEFLTVGVFENVEKIRIASFAIDELPRMSNKTGRAITRASGAQCERLRRSLSPAIFPNLKKFEFDIDMYRGRNDTNLVLALMWGWLPNLEEVIFKNSGGLSNVAFLGVKQDRPFLLLTSMSDAPESYDFKKLSHDCIPY